MSATPFYSTNLKRDIPDSVLCGDDKLARKVSRVPLRNGRPRGYWASKNNIDQLEWHSQYPGGGTSINGLISRQWFEELGADVKRLDELLDAAGLQLARNDGECPTDADMIRAIGIFASQG